MIIDGKEIAKELRENIKRTVEKLDKKPALAVILAGDDQASKIYVRNKEKACSEAGIISKRYGLDKNISQKELLDLINNLNSDNDIHGILVQLPLPKQIDSKIIIGSIDSRKDVDGFHPINIGYLFSGNEKLVSCTPKGIIKLIESTGETIQGKNAVIIGRSNIVGKPVASMLLNRHATVTICHSKTKNLSDITKKADILIAAVGVDRMVKKDWVKQGAIVIDVGMNRTDNGLFGDVDFEEVKYVARYITPVPGGVGPMTIACLLENTLMCYDMVEKNVK